MDNDRQSFNRVALEGSLPTPQPSRVAGAGWAEAFPGLVRFGTWCGGVPKLKLQALGKVIRETGLAQATWWAITYGIPRNLLGAHWTEFAPGLCLGSQHTRWGRRVLRLRGIRAAVNMREDYDDVANGVEFPYHLQPALQTPDLVEQLKLGLAFIYDLRSRGEKVYIHCSSGVHRAAAMAIACLVSEGWSLPKAKAHLISRRRGVSIWPSRELEVLQAVESFLAERRQATGK